MKFKQPLEDETLDDEFEAEPVEIIEDIDEDDVSDDDVLEDMPPLAAGPLTRPSRSRG